MANEEQTKKLPEFIKKIDNGQLEIETKDGVFIMEEKSYDIMERAFQRAPKKQNLALISESLVKPKMGELEIGKLKGSSVVRLTAALNLLYDLQDFLSTQSNG